MESTEHLEAEFEALMPQAAALAKASAILKRVAQGLSRPGGYESLKGVDKALAKLDDLDGVPDDLVVQAHAAAAPVRAWLTQEWDRRALRFVDEARAYFSDRSVALTGDPPDLYAPPVVLRVEAAKDRVDLLYAGEPVKTGLPMAADRIFRERDAVLQRLGKGATSPDVLADQLMAAYDALTETPGARVRLPDIHFQLFVSRQTAQSRTTLTKSRIKEYPRAQFAWDLAGLLAVPHFLTRDGRTLELIQATASAASSRTAAVALVDPDGRSSIHSSLRVE